ncbi:MAG: tetratricopeptide repeat protein [Bacteroidales bacterium]|nr:tetratricopeptide repeat protein [Bacteroidales bacterium]
MEQISKYQNYIQPFLDGELSREELDWINKELENNAVLAEDIKLYREVDNAIRDEDVLDLRDQLNIIHNNLGDEVSNPKKPVRYRKAISYAAIASVAILISVGVMYKLQTRKLSNQEIYEKYYEPYEVTMVYRSAESSSTALLQEARQMYEAGLYTDAIALYEEVLMKDPEDMESTLYSGISYLETDQYVEADKSFNTILDQNDNLFIEQAEWCLGFCYLMTNDMVTARKHFESIANSNSSYKDSAGKIVKRLK